MILNLTNLIIVLSVVLRSHILGVTIVILVQDILIDARERLSPCHYPRLKSGASTGGCMSIFENYLLYWTISIMEAQNFIETLKFDISRLTPCYEHSGFIEHYWF